MIELQRVVKRYGEVVAVDHLSLRVEAGELLVLLGESGCGKTTTLKMINRLIEQDEGEVVIDGKPVTSEGSVRLRRSMGYVFQRIGLFPHMTVAENVGVVPTLLEWDEGTRRRRVDELLEMVGLEPVVFRERLPGALSGGQQQRVGVARALAARPRVVLMDEPFGSLDPLTRDRLQVEYRAIHDRLGVTTVMVTHDMTEALLLADRIAVMREGRLVRVGTPGELLTDPQSEYVDRLMGTPRRQAARLEALRAEHAGA